MDVNETRIAKLRLYLFDIIDNIVTDTKYNINANMLSNDINNYSLDKIPTATIVEKWITGLEIHKDIYSFRSRNSYSQDTINNLQNIGFFETFEKLVADNNKEGILPQIDGIQTIKCLNCGTLASATTNTAEFNIQIQIEYKLQKYEDPVMSL